VTTHWVAKEERVPHVTSTPLTRGTAAALAAGVTLGSLGSNVMPALLGDITASRHLSSTSAGAIATAQLLATAVVVLGLAGRAGHPGRARIARRGLFVAAAGFAASMAAPEPVTLGLANVVAGAGVGAVGAMALAGLPNTDDPDRATKITVLCNVLGVAVVLAGVAGVSALVHGGGFLLLAVICLAVVPLAGRLPDAPADGHAALRSQQRLPSVRRGSAIVAGAAVFAATDLGLWAHAENLGKNHAGITEGVLVGVLSAGVLAGLAGVVAAAWMSGRWLRTVPLAAFLLTGTALKALIALTTSPVLFAVAIALWNVTYPAVVLLLLIICGVLDGRGRWSAILGGGIGLGTAFGPLIAGAALDFSPIALSITLAAGGLLATAMILPIALATDREAGVVSVTAAAPVPDPV
jgi:predicted MFS family arabinose efflux permease